MSGKTQRVARLGGWEWELKRRGQLRREPSCRRCLSVGVMRAAREVDHVVALHRGGTNGDDNLQSLCRECHRDKTAEDRGHRVRPRIGLDGLVVEERASVSRR